MSLQTWEEQAENHAAFVRYLEVGHRRGRRDASVYRVARRRGFCLALSLIINVVLLALVFSRIL